jgi:N-acetylmuramoyl-L-alanine amidase
MAKKLKRPLAMLLVLLAVLLYGCEAMPAASYKLGSSGEEVKKIQQRLRDWGYYKGEVDGKYGEATRAAVIWFQKKHGLTADGIVGARTAEKLGVAAPRDSGSSSKSDGNSSDLYLLARLVYGEARGEPYKGMVAVAAVVLNRVKSSKFPDSIAKVIYQSGAFSVVDDGQINLTPNQQSLDAARDAMNGWDPSGGALFYFEPNKATSKWIWSRPQIVTIGNHIFCE